MPNVAETYDFVKRELQLEFIDGGIPFMRFTGKWVIATTGYTTYRGMEGYLPILKRKFETRQEAVLFLEEMRH